ncbi:NAD-dependent epimerase/dehydratase family protein [Bradyrhizobium septentrionale]|uniref:NAD-dependent epimerase/dehydratase family protein n=1 Tax=Bradyrhizobium septentrionale TaxID=1404411 RepID=A0A973W4E3_9BRAD|nr:NAD-dependent epimerase/dehydratase family protein [Bradyrhizobium septentrionale]UGY16075.1 NAD-dependent epimerase/dehydratase family protein [Bradyrhizobium septentrionale]UGY24648.1 NAD-dependent epimerase/dehydratase family protein [Bradyrhizobium septentrionale]
MRIIITGGAGCLGSNLIEHWLPQGHEILVIDNFATGKREVVPALPGLTLIEGSIADRDLVASAFEKFRPTHVVHSAASYKDLANWREDIATNVDGTANVIDAARAAGAGRILNFQTVLCYGRPESTPIPVEHPLRPFTSYGISKVAGEQYLAMSGLPYVSLRLANVTGPRLAIGPIPTFYKRLKAGQGCFCSDAQRDFLDMSDFLAALDLAMAEQAPTGVFNVSSGIGHSIKEIYDLVRSHLGLPADPDVKVVPVGDDDVPSVVPDPSRTRAVLGWQAKVPFDETIKRLLAWYDAYGVSDVYSHLAAPKS